MEILCQLHYDDIKSVGGIILIGYDGRAVEGVSFGINFGA
jgi:hypothetical protein